MCEEYNFFFKEGEVKLNVKFMKRKAKRKREKYKNGKQ